MVLGELIEFLASRDPGIQVPLGFWNPHSYRGYYNELAFEPAAFVTVADMCAAARSALDATYEGYKGGSYRMGYYTQVWLANEGESNGEIIGPTLLRYMLGEI